MVRNKSLVKGFRKKEMYTWCETNHWLKVLERKKCIHGVKQITG